MDGRNAFFDAKAGRRQCRNELERTCLHHQLNGGVVGLKGLASLPTWFARSLSAASTTPSDDP